MICRRVAGRLFHGRGPATVVGVLNVVPWQVFHQPRDVITASHVTGRRNARARAVDAVGRARRHCLCGRQC